MVGNPIVDLRSVEWDNELGVVNLCLNQVAYSGLLVAAGSLATSANLEHEVTSRKKRAQGRRPEAISNSFAFGSSCISTLLFMRSTFTSIVHLCGSNFYDCSCYTIYSVQTHALSGCM